MIKNVIFDMGNVLLDYNPQLILDYFVKDAEEQKIIYKELFNGPEWIAADYGYIDCDEMYLLVRQRVPDCLYGSLKKCVYSWYVTLKPINGAKDFISRLNSEGYKVFLLSNASRSFYEYFPKFYPFEAFAGIVLSADVNMIKPDKKIYEYLLKKYSLQPEECLFIDDRENNINAAIKLGINGHIFKEDYPEIIRKYELF